MDKITENKVLNNLVKYMDESPNRTLLVSTHRQSILNIVDRVIVIDQGRIVSDGPRVKAPKRNSKPQIIRRPPVNGTKHDKNLILPS